MGIQKKRSGLLNQPKPARTEVVSEAEADRLARLARQVDGPLSVEHTQQPGHSIVERQRRKFLYSGRVLVATIHDWRGLELANVVNEFSKATAALSAARKRIAELEAELAETRANVAELLAEAPPLFLVETVEADERLIESVNIRF